MFKWIWNTLLNCYVAEHNSTIRADKDGNVFGGGGSKTTTVTQPGANVPPYEMSPEEKELLRLQAQMVRTTLPSLESYYREVEPLERERMISREQFVSPILRGERLPGIYGRLGAPLGEGEEAELFARGKRRTEMELNKFGLLDSGITAEMLRRTSRDIALQSASQQRSELGQLLNLAYGMPITAIPLGQTAAESASQSILGLGEGRRGYELAAEQARTPRVAAAFQSPGKGQQWGQIAGQLGGLAMMKMFMGCLPEGTLIMINSKEALPIEELIEGDNILGGKVLKIQRMHAPGFQYKEILTPKGTVICSADHPLFEPVLEIKNAKEKYRFAFDILTTSGFYYVSKGIKVGCGIVMTKVKNRKRSQKEYAKF